ncbi:MAG: respiratory nitrate reductase subunit gamma [Firmicutes bacterium]|nr:respiratory nitrate reductase subunit gamma [Bacillota bacterium]
MSLIIGQILPYITITLFTLGVLYRLGRWVGPRIVHNITLSPWMKTNTAVTIRVAEEAFLFRNLFRFDKVLWLGAILMHFSLLNVLGGHVVGFGTLGKQFAFIPGLGITEDLSEQMSNLLGSVFGLLLLLTLLFLLYRRLTLPKVKLVSSISDNLWLVFLILLVGVGDLMRFFEFAATNVDYKAVQDYLVALALFKPVTDMPLLSNYFFLTHFLLVQILLIVFPFSKLMHIFGMFAERWIINRVYKDPAPGLPNVDVAAARLAGIGVPSGDAAEEGV